MQREATMVSIRPDEYRAFQDFLRQACGIMLGSGKEYLITSRLSGLMAEIGVDSFAGLLERLRSVGQTQLKVRVIDAMTTNETFWFRDISHFELLKGQLLPELNARIGGSIRIWSAACSSGQEPYNISMVVEDYQRSSVSERKRPVEILATDISTKVLEEARQGVYCGMSIDRGLTTEQHRRYFITRDNCLEVRPEIRHRVRFRELNLTNEFESLGRFDAIFCRNVLIYFSNELKRDIVNRLARALNPGGYLFLGSTESINQLTDRFQMQLSGGGISYRLKD
ncbi:MAG: protein-glutamate O-methyltransferase CheR [Pseudomonadota bacterium]